jgi:hypothetical protein
MTTSDAIKLMFQFLDYAIKIYAIISATPTGQPIDLTRLEIKETFWESLRRAGVSDEAIKKALGE